MCCKLIMRCSRNLCAYLVVFIAFVFHVLSVKRLGEKRQTETKQQLKTRQGKYERDFGRTRQEQKFFLFIY